VAWLRAVLEAALIGAGVLLLGVNAAVVGWATWAARADRWALEHAIAARETAPPLAPRAARDSTAQLTEPPSPFPDASPDASEWSRGRIQRWRDARPEAVQERLALLEIPRLGLQVVVLEGTSEWALTRGVGRIEGTAVADQDGNLGIAGHRDGYFRALRHLRPGDQIRLRTPAVDRSYRVEWIRVVEPDDRWVLERTPEPALTLVTCYPFWFVGHAPQRFVVRALEEGEPPPPAPAPGQRAAWSPG
jgi:sortase A